MSSSLENLVKNLKDGGKFTHLEKEFGSQSKLLKQKGIYPYSFMDHWDKFDVLTKDLKKEHFTNDLAGEEIKDNEFEFYNKVCNELHLKTLGEYHDLYLKTDVLLLADVFENFRKVCLSCYSLDPCHYFSAPGLAWDACLKMSEIKLELISDVDMYNFVEKGLRGGLSVITHRKATANNKYMKGFDVNKPKTYIPYLDANNLYGWAMKQYLPYEGFKWISPEEFALSNVKTNSKIGHILEVDLEYPKELHDLHNDYPYCPEHLNITPDMLSNYSKNVAGDNGMKCGKSNKLAATLKKKEKYVIHERNLKQAVDAGLLITKVHRVLEFKQKPWMEKYIDFNTDKRKQAKNDFEKDFYKLMNNSVFGKTMENLRKRRNIKLITDSKMFKKYVAKPTFVTGVIFNDDLVGVEYVKENLKLNKPIYVGFSILDLSKTLMYDFHYGFIKQKYGDNAKLLFTDTDSLCYEIKTNDFYKDMYNSKEMFDLSDMKGEFNDNTNKKVIGKMKMEYPDNVIREFIGLKSKMYSIKLDDGKESKKAKGVKKYVINKDLKHEHYDNILMSGTTMYSKMKLIRSMKHLLYTLEQNKVSLSAYDDKRYIDDDGISSLAYGHHMIE
jgi:hypothetical protein